VNESEVFTNVLMFATPAEQAAYLDEACGGDPRLRAAVEALLRARASDPDFLEQPAGSLAGTTGSVFSDRATATTDSIANEQPGIVLAGRYKLLEEIGEGGMGTVWMAQQQEPVKRLVAVKLIKPGMDSKAVLARFEAERQALALMDHPNIAKVFDAGTTEPNGRTSVGLGRPYFVMELVKGVPITEFCDKHRLTPRQRLELFVPVCQAIQHAHQKGVIHRDLKPSNVLVALYDDKPVPKVIDFGVAKATGVQLTEETLHTSFGAVVGTVEYMSPEQATFNQLDIDTRSDIYSLGVLLYELLTGTTPLQKKRVREATLLEVLRLVREEEPPRPSTRLSTTEELPSIAANRGVEPKKLRGLVRGELDWIVMKALEKDRNRRYETANGLAMDVQRYLADEVVAARPPSTAYRLRKFARRNRAHLALATALGVLLLGAGAFAWYSDHHAAQRRTRLQLNAGAVAALLDQCEEALQADRADRAAITLEAAEQRAADGGADNLAGRLRRCQTDLKLLRALDAINTFRWTWAGGGHPSDQLVTARWQAALADYGVTQDEDRAEEAAERVNGSLVRDRLLTALDRWLAMDRSAGVRAVLRSADPDPYRDAVRDAVVVKDRNRIADLAAQPEALEQPARFAAILGQLGAVPMERRRAVLESALRARTGDLELLMALGKSYPTYRPGARAGSANQPVRVPLGKSSPVQRPEGADERVRWYQAVVAAHPGNLAALNNLGVALLDQGKPDAAIASFREALRLDPKFPFAHVNLGVALWAKSDLDGAIAAYREAIRLDPKYAFAHINFGSALWATGDPDGAIASFREALQVDPECAPAHNELGLALWDKGNSNGAIAAYREAIRLDPEYAEPHVNLGFALQSKGDPDGAITSFKEAIRLEPKDASVHVRLGAILCDVKRDYGGAITAFKEAIRLNPNDSRAHVSLGVALRDKGDPDAAIAAYREAIRLDPEYAYAHLNLGYSLQAKGDSDGAIAAYREAIRLNPKDASFHFRLGVILCDVKRDYGGAIAAFKEAIRLDPKDSRAHGNLGVALRGKGHPDAAIATYREAIRLDPKNASFHVRLGAILCDVKHDYDGAINAFNEAIRLNPNYADAHFDLGIALLGKRDLDGAIAAFREAIRLAPRHADAHINLSWLLAAGPDPVRDGKRAIEHATRACELTEWKNPEFIGILAAAYAEAGDFDRAVEFQKKALAFPAVEKEPGKVGRERLALYERKKPYRDPSLTPREVAPPPREVKPNQPMKPGQARTRT
jgi:eukaryotic-like serine/threonine-protein kinase